MKKHQERIIRVLLVVGLLVGCFPAKNLWRASQYLKFEWLSLPVFYTFVFLVFEIVVQVDFLVARTEEYVKIFFPSTFMMEFGQFAVSLFANTLRRLTSFHTSRRVINLIKLHGEFRTEADDYYRFHCNCSYWIVILCALFSFVQNCIIVEVHFSEQPEHIFPMLPITSACLSIAFEILGAICSVFGLSITVLFSQEGLFGFECICEEFKGAFLQEPNYCSSSLKSDFVKTGSPPRSFVSSVLAKGNGESHFQNVCHLTSLKWRLVKMRRIFEECTGVAGVYVLTLMLQSTFQFIYYGYGTLYRNEACLRAMSIAGLLSSTTLMLTLLHQGNGVKMRIEKQKKDIQEAMFLIGSGGSNHDLVKSIGDFICSWNYEFSAMGLFGVDYQLIPRLLGVMMTYIIFLFQLKLSERGIPDPEE